MIKIDVRGIPEVQRNLARIASDLRDKATTAALNKVADKGRTEMTRAITDEFALKQSEVRPRLRILKANRGALTAILDPFASRRRGRSLNLIHFLERKVTLAEAKRRRKSGTQAQLRFQIKKRGGIKTVTGAFIGNRGRTVFKRVGNARLPIQAVSTIDVPSMFNTRHINRRVVARLQRELGVEFERAVNLVLSRR